MSDILETKLKEVMICREKAYYATLARVKLQEQRNNFRYSGVNLKITNRVLGVTVDDEAANKMILDAHLLNLDNCIAALGNELR